MHSAADNQPLLWTGPRRGGMLFYSLGLHARRVAGHRASSVIGQGGLKVRRQFLFILLLLAGCKPTTATRSSPDLRAAFAESVELFAQYSLPNSMTRPPGFDVDGYLDQVHRHFESASAVLRTPEGISFLSGRLRQEQDSLTLICGLTILSESRLPPARQLIAPYTRSSDSTVAEHAADAMAQLADAR